MSFRVGSEGHFDPETFAKVLTTEVVPSLLSRSTEDSIVEELGSEQQALEQQTALLQATQQLVPPDDLPAAGDTYATLMGMVVFRAVRDDLVNGGYVSTSERYRAAAKWVCENFGEVIWWNCD